MIETATHNSLQDTLLIAMPQMNDPHFTGAVIYLCEHNEEGSMGVVINRPLDISVEELFKKIDIDYLPDQEQRMKSVFLGGPVDTDHGFILHTYSGELDESVSIPVTSDIALTSSRDILTSIGSGEGPHLALITLGYAGWGAGQLEQELASNLWLNSPADKAILFTTPFEQRLERAVAKIGIDLNMLSLEAGHA
ncbi:YqgE/AlgH family protein [Parendozoicomonas sp. Alg238-R29]|uniref:YqgE/AlgH family protein n=1 Tax=Parendozoicomonas sp. Alg238-R29 TaxID=2993446 RepID=UPI00248D754A|nr:YqgE/AlgH family protein [Parendozoicomonas sp. Alg238-R29]